MSDILGGRDEVTIEVNVGAHARVDFGSHQAGEPPLFFASISCLDCRAFGFGWGPHPAVAVKLSADELAKRACEPS